MRAPPYGLCALAFLPGAALVLAAACPAAAGEYLAAGAKAVRVAGGCKFTEGPAVDREGNLFFSDGPNDRILRLTGAGELTVFRQPCGRANGLEFDAEGRLVMCQSNGPGGGRRVSRLEHDGSETVLAESYQGRPFIGPNDLAIDGKGHIYFTDPNYLPADETPDLPPAVYRIDAPGKVTRLLEGLERPNGIVLTPDGGALYVSDRATQKLHRFRVADDGGLQADAMVYDFSPDRGIDGMCLDSQGNIVAAAGQNATSGLFVVSPQGALLCHFPLPEFATNVAFGGADLCDLYITASSSVYRLRSRVPGGPPLRGE
jgi:gluconolactonase